MVCMVVYMIRYNVNCVFNRISIPRPLTFPLTAYPACQHAAGEKPTTVHPGEEGGNWGWPSMDGHFHPHYYSRRFVHGTSPSAGGSMPPHAHLSPSLWYAAGPHDPVIDGRGEW
jgi:hypothetical protein